MSGDSERARDKQWWLLADIGLRLRVRISRWDWKLSRETNARETEIESGKRDRGERDIVWEQRDRCYESEMNLKIKPIPSSLPD